MAVLYYAKNSRSFTSSSHSPSRGTSILEEDRKRKRKGKAKEETKEVKRPPKDTDQMMIKGAETNKLSNIIREQCLNNYFEINDN